MSQSLEHRIMLTKGREGWEADTHVDLGGEYILRVFTMKRYSGDLVTTATRMKKTAGEFLGLSFIMHQDFNTVVRSQRVRVTSRAVELQHKAALEEIESIKARMNAFYADKTQQEACYA